MRVESADDVIKPEHFQEKSAVSRLLLADMHEKEDGIVKVKNRGERLNPRR